MPKRSQFLSMLSQVGWEELDLASKSGAATARLVRSEQKVRVEIFEGGHVLAVLEASGGSAREIVGSMEAVSGLYLDLFGVELAWVRSLELLFDMEAHNVGLSKENVSVAGMLPSRKLNTFANPHLDEGKQ